MAGSILKALHFRLFFAIIFVMYSISVNGLIKLGELQNSENFMWFPNPDESGSFYPTYLASSKKQLMVAEQHEKHDADHYHPYHDHGHGHDYHPEDHVHFYHYIREHTKGTEIHISREKNSIDIPKHFKPGAPIKILIHGFLGKPNMPFPKNLKNEYLHLEYDVNIIIVDWSKLAKKRTTFIDWENIQSYYKVAFNIIPLGEKIGKLITLLVKDGGVSNLDKVHIIGYGLGSHAGAVAAESIKSLGKIGRITGLNPPRPGFGPNGFMKPEYRLHKESADFVDVIHTNDGAQEDCGFSFHSPLGHADFYPNGGIHQPGCEGASVGSAKCRQARAHQYYEESVKSTVGFKGCKCDTWATYLNGECICDEHERILMGEHCPHSARGKFFLKTRSEPPFVKGSTITYDIHHHHPIQHPHHQTPTIMVDNDDFNEMYH